jgi:hypothetical protein
MYEGKMKYKHDFTGGRDVNVIKQLKIRSNKYLLFDILPPGPLPDSKIVTEIPLEARIEAQTAPETVINSKQKGN